MKGAQQNYSPVTMKSVHRVHDIEIRAKQILGGKYMRNDYTRLSEYIANTVARNIRRSAYACITLANIVGITFEMTWVDIVASVMGIRREGTPMCVR